MQTCTIREIQNQVNIIKIMISDPLNSHSNDKNVHKTRKKTPFFHGREGRRYKETAERVYQKKDRVKTPIQICRRTSNEGPRKLYFRCKITCQVHTSRMRDLDLKMVSKFHAIG